MPSKPNFNKSNSLDENITYDKDQSYIDSSLFNDNQTNVDIDEDFDFDGESTFPERPNDSNNSLQGTIKHEQSKKHVKPDASLGAKKQQSKATDKQSKVAEKQSKMVDKQSKVVEKQSKVVVDADDWNGSIVDVENKTKKTKRELSKEKAEQKRLKQYKKKQALAGRVGHENDQVEDDITDKIKAKLPLIGGVIGGVAVIGLVAFLFRDSFDDKALVEAEKAPEITAEQLVDNQTEQEAFEVTDEQAVETAETTVESEAEPDVTTGTAKGLDVTIPVVVNTKLASDDAYTDHESTISVRLNPVITDRETVESLIDEYNNFSTESMIDKEQLNAEETVYIVYEATLGIPSDYPTVDELGVKSYFKPDVMLSIVGTEEQDSVITEKYIVKAPKAVDISAFDTSELNVGTEYNYRWLVPMVSGAEAVDYNVVLEIEAAEVDGGSYTLTFDGDQILGE